MNRIMLTLLVLAAMVAACTGDSSPDVTVTTATPGSGADVPASSAAAPVEVQTVFLHADRTHKTIRFVVNVRNSSPKTVEGMRLSGNAYDASGAAVGRFTGDLPRIAAGSTFPYVGGIAGMEVTGIATRLDVTVASAGRLTDAPADLFATETDAPVQNGTRLEEMSYTVSGLVTTGSQEIERRQSVVSAILRDGAGAIVGVQYERLTTVPDRVPPGTRARVELLVIQLTGTATKAELIAYAVGR